MIASGAGPSGGVSNVAVDSVSHLLIMAGTDKRRRYIRICIWSLGTAETLSPRASGDVWACG